MRIPRKYLLGGIAVALLGAGAAQAATARLHTVETATPDGRIVEVRYTGDIAPQVHFEPAIQPISIVDPLARIERISAMMDAQMDAMLQQATLIQRAALIQRAEVNGTALALGKTLAGTLPAGAHVTYYSSTTDANGCTRTVSYSSDGTNAQPKLTRAASDACDRAKPDNTVTAVNAVVPASPSRDAPGQKV